MKLTTLESKIAALATPVVAEVDFALLTVRVQSGVVQIFAENPATRNLGIEDCVCLHKALFPVLMAQGGLSTDMRLEVSSPGLDRPLVKPQDFVDYMGREVKIELDMPDAAGQKRFRGVIKSLEEDNVILETEGQQKTLPLASIARAKLTV